MCTLNMTEKRNEYRANSLSDCEPKHSAFFFFVKKERKYQCSYIRLHQFPPQDLEESPLNGVMLSANEYDPKKIPE